MKSLLWTKPKISEDVKVNIQEDIFTRPFFLMGFLYPHVQYTDYLSCFSSECNLLQYESTIIAVHLTVLCLIFVEFSST